eukprot:761298-Hanusia_phi.AAC.6
MVSKICTGCYRPPHYPTLPPALTRHPGVPSEPPDLPPAPQPVCISVNRSPYLTHPAPPRTVTTN